MKRLLWSALASLLLAVPVLAQATEGYVTGNVNMRAGPAPDYPLIAQIRAGTDVDVQGCTEGWEWCDVIVYDNRGWIAGNYIQYDYQDRYVLLPSYGAQIGIPIITFVIGNYWDHYYRNRPFYRERNHWYRRPYVRRPPPPPMHRPYVRPRGHARPMPRPNPGMHRPPASPPRSRPSTRPDQNHRPAAPRSNVTRSVQHRQPQQRVNAPTRVQDHRAAPGTAGQRPPDRRGDAKSKSSDRKHDRKDNQGH